MLKNFIKHYDIKCFKSFRAVGFCFFYRSGDNTGSDPFFIQTKDVAQRAKRVRAGRHEAGGLQKFEKKRRQESSPNGRNFSLADSAGGDFFDVFNRSAPSLGSFSKIEFFKPQSDLASAFYFGGRFFGRFD